MADTNTAQTFVLVPGAWLGSWSWQPVARLLAARGNPRRFRQRSFREFFRRPGLVTSRSP
jgi:hypothetical protein